MAATKTQRSSGGAQWGFREVVGPTTRAARMGRTKPSNDRPFIRADMSASREALDHEGMAALARMQPEALVRKIEDLISAGKFRIRDIPDIRAFYRTFFPIKVKTTVDVGAGMRAAVETSAFPLLMGNLVVDELNRAYDEVPTIGQELVQDIESNKKFAHVVKIVNNVSQELETKEGDEFPMISAGEQFSVIGHKRKGFQLSLSQEAIDEGDIGNFLSLVDQGGQFAGELIEEQTLSRCHDQNGSANAAAEPFAYRPNGAATALYSTTANLVNNQTPSGTRAINNPLASVANLDAVRLMMSAMQNTRGRRIAVPMSEINVVVPDALLSTALNITRSTMEPGVWNQENNWGPQGMFRPGLISSPKLDDISTTAWIYGALKRQMRRKWKIRLETVSVYSDPMTYLRTREAYRTRVCWDVEIGAIDNVFAIQSLSGTVAATAPTKNNQNA